MPAYSVFSLGRERIDPFRYGMHKCIPYGQRPRAALSGYPLAAPASYSVNVSSICSKLSNRQSQTRSSGATAQTKWAVRMPAFRALPRSHSRSPTITVSSAAIA